MIYRYDRRQARRRLREYSFLSELLFLALSVGIGFVIAYLAAPILREKLAENRQIFGQGGCYLLGILSGLPGHFSRKKLRMTGYVGTANGSIAIINRKFSKKAAKAVGKKIFALMKDDAFLYRCATEEKAANCATVNKVYAIREKKHSVSALCDVILPSGRHKKQNVKISDCYAGYDRLVETLKTLNKLTTLKIRK